jgi:hypothetical protein
LDEESTSLRGMRSTPSPEAMADDGSKRALVGTGRGGGSGGVRALSALECVVVDEATVVEEEEEVEEVEEVEEEGAVEEEVPVVV